MSAPSPLLVPVAFHVGPVRVSQTVVTTWCIVAILGAVAFVTTRNMSVRPGRRQAAVEAFVILLEDQLRGILRRDPAPFLPLIGALFLFIAAANVSGVVPSVRAPTASLETPAALALIVFFAVHVYGIREKGLAKYLKGYLQPNVLMLPLNVLSEMTRTFSLTVRLFGNIMSHELIVAIVVTLAGLLLPIPFMALGILVGLFQAYIFSILATVFIGAGVETHQKARSA